MRRFLFGLSALAFVLAGCASSGGDDSQKQIADLEKKVEDLKAEQSTTTAPPEAVVETSEVAATQPPATAAPTTAAPTTAAPSPSLMPDVVCMNLQDAQDYIQETTDVFLSLSEDATGQGRSQLIDSNWIVVSQTPAPGTPIGEGDAVLSAVKLDEPNDC